VTGRFSLDVAMTVPSIADAVDRVAKLDAFRMAPRSLDVDDDERPVDAAWPAALRGAREAATARWTPPGADHATMIDVWVPGRRVLFQAPSAFSTVDEAIAMIETLPFDVASFGSLHPDAWRALDRELVGFGDRHYAHGWGCAFRGAGHDRLVSRRWLDHGPWRVIRRPDDLTVVVFHDLDLDAAQALAQAAPGHRRMGIADTGGFIQAPYPFTADVGGLYDGDRMTLEIVVPPGGEITQRRMLDACAVRYLHRIEPPSDAPIIDQVAFVFLDEAEARRHLPELWLRELECWVADDRPKRRLDVAYKPIARTNRTHDSPSDAA
jgi:hypothetical protein